MLNSSRVERLIDEAVRKLPYDVLSLIANHHTDIWERKEQTYEMRQETVVFELESTIEMARFHYYLDLLGSDDAAFYCTYIRDSHDEPDWISQLPSRMLQRIRSEQFTTRSRECPKSPYGNKYEVKNVGPSRYCRACIT